MEKTNNKKYLFCGIEKSLKEWSIIFEIPYRTLKGRVQKGYIYSERVLRRPSSLYTCYKDMIRRCRDPKHSSYSNYKDKEIEESFLLPDIGFYLFWAEVGDHPGKGLSLDRIDNNKGYLIGNLRWADGTTQLLNRDKTGVSFHKASGLYRARLYRKGVNLLCKYFKTYDEAKLYYEKEKQQYL